MKLRDTWGKYADSHNVAGAVAASLRRDAEQGAACVAANQNPAAQTAHVAAAFVYLGALTQILHTKGLLMDDDVLKLLTGFQKAE